MRFAGSDRPRGPTLPPMRADPGLDGAGPARGRAVAGGARVDRRPLRAAGGLVQACHPLPCLAVTAFTTAYAIALGLPPARTLLLAAAALAGQLAVGWTNDRVDAARDTAAGRPGQADPGRPGRACAP